jgi:hypothetical protein
MPEAVSEGRSLQRHLLLSLLTFDSAPHVLAKVLPAAGVCPVHLVTLQLTTM